MDKVDKADWGYVNVEPDPDFDADHNKRVIDDVIRKNEINFARKQREYKRASGERISAIASYVKSISKDKSNTTPEQYFGKRYIAELRGKQIMEKLKDATKKH